MFTGKCTGRNQNIDMQCRACAFAYMVAKYGGCVSADGQLHTCWRDIPVVVVAKMQNPIWEMVTQKPAVTTPGSKKSKIR